MHHPQPKSRSSCSCRSTGDGPAATLLSLFGPAAVLTPRSTVLATVATADFWTNPEAPLFDASVNPDPPPPRA
jgi:MYXO-CTERM domain-containing protein